MYAHVFVCFHVRFGWFVYTSDCLYVRLFPFQTCTQHPTHTHASTCARGESESAPNTFRTMTPRTPPSHLPSPSLSSSFIHHMQRDNQSSGERGLGSFFFPKDTFEMAGHVTEEDPLPCQVTSAACGQVHLMGRHINTHIQHTQQNLTQSHTSTASQFLCLSCGALKRSVPRFHWNHLQVQRPCFVPRGHLKEKCLEK